MQNKNHPSQIGGMHIPEEVPRFGNALTRAIGRGIMRLMGWRIEGELPAVPRSVFAAAPHTSNWDFLLAMACVMALGVKISFLMKKEAFFWPCKNLFMSLGGLPLDRNAADDTVGQLSGFLKNSDNMWLVITPEGTRAQVDKWKTGFLRVAHAADVPVVLFGWDYPSKTMHLDKAWYPRGDYAEEAQEIREYLCGKYTGKHKVKQ